MIPGEYRIKQGIIEGNVGRRREVIIVSNTGDRPVQVGSHYHFFEVNSMLQFERSKSIGMRLNIAAGTAVRFEPGEEKEIELVELGGNKQVYGLNNLTDGAIEEQQKLIKKAQENGFKGA